MASILEEIYHGNTSMIFDQSIRSDSYKKSLKAVCEAEEKLLKEFPECKELFKEYQNAHFELITESYYQRFLLGFKVGAQLMEEMKKPIE